MRLLLDTCVIIDWLTLYVSAETARELIVSFNNKKLLSKYWKTAEDVGD